MSQETSQTNPSVFALRNPEGLYDPTPNGYSHVASVASGVRLLLIAGQSGEAPDGSLEPDFRAQVRQAFQNVLTALRSEGASGNDIIKMTVLIVDHTMDRLQIYGEEMGRALGDGMKPASTLIPVPRLALDEMMFEVEAIAAVQA